MSACGSDDSSLTNSLDTTSAPSTSSETPTTEPSVRTEVPTTTVVAETTEAPRTTAATERTASPTTTEPPETTASPTTTAATETTDAPTTTVAAELEPARAAGALDFHLDDDPGATPTVFGYAALTEVDETSLVEDVSEALGGADADTGWATMPSAYACTGAAEYRSLLWDDIRYVLIRRDVNPGTTYLSAWTVGDTALAFSPPLDAEITDASGITADDGIGLGTSADRLELLEWDQSLREDDRFLGLAGIGPVTFQLDASNQVVAMSYEQNDC